MEEKESIDVFFKILEYKERYLYIPKTLWNKEAFKEVSYSRFIVDELAKLIADNEDEDYKVIFDDFINKVDVYTHKGSWESKKMFAIMKNTLESIFYYINNPLPYY